MKKTVFVLVGLVAVGALAQVSPYAPIVSYDPFGWEATNAKIVKTLDYSGGSGAWPLYTADGVAAPVMTFDCLGSQYAGGATWPCTGLTFAKTSVAITTANTIFYPSGFSSSAGTAPKTSNVGDYFDGGDALDPIEDFSGFAVIMPTTISGNRRWLQKGGGAPGGSDAFILRSETGGAIKVYVFKSDGTNSSITCCASCAVANAWQAVTFSYDYVTDGTSVLRCMVNGTAATNVTNAKGPIKDVTNPWRIAGYTGSSEAQDGIYYRVAFLKGTAWNDNQVVAVNRSLRGLMPNGVATPFTRSTVTTCAPIVGTPTMQTLGPNWPCYTDKGVRLWPGYTNYIKQSEDITTTWTADGSGSPAPTLTANQYTSPDGIDFTGDKVEFPETPNATDRSLLGSGITSSLAAGPAIASVWARAHSGTATLRMYTTTGNCNNITTTTCSLTTSWSLCELPFTATAAAYYLVFGTRMPCSGHTDLGAQTVGLWGAQLTQTKTRAPYIKTTTAAVTASADALSATNPATTLGPLAISVKYTSPDWNPATSATYSVPLALGADAANNSIVIRRLNDGSFSGVVQDNAGGTITTNGTPPGTTDLTEYWFTAGYTNTGAAKLYQTKTPFGTQSGAGTGVVNSPSATIYIGSSNGSSGDPGYYKKVNICTGNNYKSCAR